MPSLLDIAPPELSPDHILVGGAERSVCGVKARAFAQVLRRYPAFARAIAGRAVDDDEHVPMILETAPALVAAAMGRAGDEALEAEIGDELTVEEAMQAFQQIMALSTPPGPGGPFVAAAGNGAARSTAAPATT